MTDLSRKAGTAPRRGRYQPTQRGGEAAYRAAERHSRLVGRLKVILPLAAVAGIGLFFATVRFIPSDLTSLISLAGVDVESGNVVMNRPQISGFEGTRRAYEVKADRAVQSLDNPRVVTFEEISARIGMDGEGTATLGADTGVYDGNIDTLLLKERIAVNTTSGYEAILEEARIDLRNGSLVSTRPIEIRSHDGTIRANEVVVSERGKKVIFRKGVSVTYMPPGETFAAPADMIDVPVPVLSYAPEDQ
jgi:lipopolysaccharide export system protein LptC